jgi:hypothetical protein
VKVSVLLRCRHCGAEKQAVLDTDVPVGDVQMYSCVKCCGEIHVSKLGSCVRTDMADPLRAERAARRAAKAARLPVTSEEPLPEDCGSRA